MLEKNRILIVSDNADVRSFFVNILKEDYITKEADNAFSAAEIIKAYSFFADLILLDVTSENTKSSVLLEMLTNLNMLKSTPIVAIINDLSKINNVDFDWEIQDYVTASQDAAPVTLNRINRICSQFKAIKGRSSKIIFGKPPFDDKEIPEYYMDNLADCLSFTGFKNIAYKMLNENPDVNYAIWYCDIVNFKFINDTYGYSKGDALLKFWVNQIRKIMTDKEVLGRVSADNIVMLSVHDGHEAEKFNGVSKAVGDFFKNSPKHYKIVIKAGIYIIRPDDRISIDVNRFMDWANVAQKSIKNKDDANYAFFTDELWQKQLRLLEIRHYFGYALKNGEINVWVQPQYNSSTNEIVGAELLSRWNSPSLGQVSPQEFIPVLEESGQIAELDYYVWEEACRCIRRWTDADDITPLPLSVNISRYDVSDGQIYNRLEQLIKKYKIDPKMLRLEITESCYMEEPDELIDVTKHLQELGFTVEMDDFGSGYSSLNMLKDVPVDVLKVDMRFLSGINNNSRGGNILNHIVRMAHSLDITAIAEGVETLEQVNFLKDIGCSFIQGFYYSKAVPVSEFEEMLRSVTPGELHSQDLTGEAMYNVQELLTSGSRASYLFNYCIGAAAIIEFDGTVFNNVMINDDFIKLSNTEGAHRIGLNLADIVFPEDRPLLMDCFFNAIKNVTAKCAVRFKNTNKFVLITNRKISSGNNINVIFMLAQDATEIHNMAVEAKNLKEELDIQMGLKTGGVFLYEPNKNNSFRYISPSMLSYIGCKSDNQFLKMYPTFADFIFPADRVRVLSEIIQTTDENTLCTSSFRIKTYEGNIKWICCKTRLLKDAYGNNLFCSTITDTNSTKPKIKSKK